MPQARRRAPILERCDWERCDWALDDNITIIANWCTKRIIRVARIVWARHGLTCVTVTSGLSGRHSKTSSHYEGRALDLRTKFYTAHTVKALGKDLKKELGPLFYVKVEWDPWHIHVQVRRGASPPRR